MRKKEEKKQFYGSAAYKSSAKVSIQLVQGLPLVEPLREELRQVELRQLVLQLAVLVLLLAVLGWLPVLARPVFFHVTQRMVLQLLLAANVSEDRMD